MMLIVAGCVVAAAAFLGLNCMLARRDRNRLSKYIQDNNSNASGGEISFVMSANGRRIAIRTVRPPPGVPERRYSIFIPNGMATTMLMLASIQVRV